MNNPAPPLYVDSPHSLRHFCDSLRGARWLALDTEFLREKTYFPKFCLLQIAAENGVACIDPLALKSLHPLLEIIYDPNITKVFHSGRQDLEIFYHLCGKLPTPVFDTQIAAPLLGFAEQISYAGLVGELIGVNLNKAHARTDWARRPLSPEQLRYAADDVIYLSAVYQKLLPRLDKLGRLDWLGEDFAELTDPALYENPAELAWQRVSGAHQLKGQQLSVLQALAAWREQTARAKDLPRGWLLKDETIFDLARQQPTRAEELRAVRGIDDRTVSLHGPILWHLIQEARDRPPPPIELKPRPTKKTAEQEALLDVLMAVIRLRAAQNTLNPAILASRKDLEQLLEQVDNARLLQGWRKKMVGAELAAVLDGELSLTIAGGRLLIRPHA
ncbi:MAG TPA: ribonuclease D [Methylococcaceae bacterium]|nr:ribonuclease D [Methylococcaceae bacterium]